MLRPETIKLLEENLGEILIDMGLGSDFFNMTLKSQATKYNGKQMGLAH